MDAKTKKEEVSKQEEEKEKEKKKEDDKVEQCLKTAVLDGYLKADDEDTIKKLKSLNSFEAVQTAVDVLKTIKGVNYVASQTANVATGNTTVEPKKEEYVSNLDRLQNRKPIKQLN